MNWRSGVARGFLVCAFCVVPSVFSSLAVAAPQYSISLFAAPSYNVQFADLNDQGVAVGFDYANLPFAFVSDGATATALNPLVTGRDAYATSINNSGVIVGYAFTASWAVRAVQFGSSTTDLFPGAPASAQQVAWAINDAGAVAGAYGNHGFLYENGVLVDIGSLPGLTFSVGYAINASGQIAGGAGNGGQSVTNRGFIWTDGVMTNLGLPTGETSAAIAGVEAINDSGWVTGQWQRYVGGTSQNRRSFLWHDGIMSDITPSFITTGFADALDINNWGQVVGSGKKTQGAANDSVGFLWDNGTAYDLDTLVLDPNSEWIVDGAYNINNLGQVLVGARYNGQSTYALLTPNAIPTPLPAAIWLFGSGLTGLVMMARRRRT